MKVTEMSPAELRAWRIQVITDRDGPLCFHPRCDINGGKFNSEDEITFDHWIPRSLGGTWDIDNLRIMHKRCNAIKSDDMPNPDGTLPDKKRELNAFERRVQRAGMRPEVCNTCMSGRALGPEEECEVCGSGPMPRTFPQWARMKSNECEHRGIFWCWACSIGIVEREPAIMDVLDAEGSLDG